MLIKLPAAWIVILNTGGWLLIQTGLAWVFTRMPVEWFRPGRAWGWEADGRFYERFFAIRPWKGLLPDAARWFTGGFAKGILRGGEREYLSRFIRETWRGEMCHWVAIGFAPIFLLWNPWWGESVIVLYAIAANLPCILVQRYNRQRLARVLAGKKR